MSRKIVGFLNLYSSPSLGPLTEKRTLGSTSFLGRFALMDFPLSNFTNSELIKSIFLLRITLEVFLNTLAHLKLGLITLRLPVKTYSSTKKV